MKAAQINEYGESDVLKVTDSAAKQTVDADQILVKVHAAGVNPFDWKVRKGLYEVKFPATLGGDFAGTVAEIGQDVSGYKVGDEVFGQANALSGQGSYAEFTPAKATSTAKKPVSIDFETAAALPLASCSAYQALVEHAKISSGQKILIHGGAGGIGTFAIQIAKALGAYAATTVAAEDTEYVKTLGADEVIDYKSQSFWEIIKDYDAVFDTVGGDTFTKSHEVLKPGGVLVSMVGQVDEKLAKQHSIQVISQFTQVTTDKLEKVAEMVEQGKLKVQIEKVFPLDKAGEALGYIETGKHHGKVVIKIV